MNKTAKIKEPVDKDKKEFPYYSDGIVRNYQLTLTVEQTQILAAFAAKKFFDDEITDGITNSPMQQLKIWGNKKFNGGA